jgi:putative membrane protein
MKLSLITLPITILLLTPSAGVVHAQMMGDYSNQGAYDTMMKTDANEDAQSTGTSTSAESRGEILWGGLASGKLRCSDFTDSDFEELGDFFMSRMLGTRHEAIDEWMGNSLGEENDSAMHTIMGKRVSGCDESAVFPYRGDNVFFPMMGMMGDGYGHDFSSPAHALWDILLTVIVVIGIVFLVRFILHGMRTERPLRILRERYAKGELSKEAFESMRKDLTEEKNQVGSS